MENALRVSRMSRSGLLTMDPRSSYVPGKKRFSIRSASDNDAASMYARPSMSIPFWRCVRLWGIGGARFSRANSRPILNRSDAPMFTQGSSLKGWSIVLPLSGLLDHAALSLWRYSLSNLNRLSLYSALEGRN